MCKQKELYNFKKTEVVICNVQRKTRQVSHGEPNAED